MSNDTHTCDGCGIASRREFLGRLGASLTTLAAFLDVTDLSALEVVPVTARGIHGARKSYDVPATDGVRFDKDTEVILVRQGNMVWAFALSCPHQNTALKWNPRDQRFQCPKHKSKYRPDGVFIEGRATHAMDRYSIAHEGNTVVVDLDALHQQDTDPTGWASAAVTLS